MIPVTVPVTERESAPERFATAAGWTATAAVLGGAAAWLGPPALAIAAAAGGIGLLAQRPLVLVHALILYQPFDALLMRGAPAVLRSVDEVLVAATLAAVALRDLHNTGLQRLLRHPLLAPLLVFIALGVWSAAANEVPLPVAAAGSFVTVDYVLLALLVGCLHVSAADLRRLIGLLLLSAIIVSAITIVEAIVAPRPAVAARLVRMPWFTLVRQQGPFEHPNALATFMALPLAVAVGLLVYRTRMRFASIWTVMFLAVFVLAMGRMAWISFSLGAAAFAAVHHRGRLARIPAWTIVVLLLALPVVAIGLGSRVSSLIQERGGPRMHFIRNATKAAEGRVWLGVGPGRFGGVVADRYDTDIEVEAHSALRRRAWRLATLDNFWLHLLIERGVLGVSAFLVLLGIVLWRSHRLLGTLPRDHAILPLAAACFILTIYHLLYNLSAPALESNAQSAMYWLLSGLVAAWRAPDARAEA
jgi:hypothetical protein